jgi:hypothetical protein
MVKFFTMRWIKIYLICITLLIIFSCDKIFVGDIECKDCLSTEPKDTYLLLKIDAPFKISGMININVYEGLLEDNILVKTYDKIGSDFSIIVSINKEYTVTANYKDEDGNEYIVVNSITPRVKHVTSYCQGTCYIVQGTELDLSLRYR